MPLSSLDILDDPLNIFSDVPSERRKKKGRRQKLDIFEELNLKDYSADTDFGGEYFLKPDKTARTLESDDVLTGNENKGDSNISTTRYKEANTGERVQNELNEPIMKVCGESDNGQNDSPNDLKDEFEKEFLDLLGDELKEQRSESKLTSSLIGESQTKTHSSVVEFKESQSSNPEEGTSIVQNGSRGASSRSQTELKKKDKKRRTPILDILDELNLNDSNQDEIINIEQNQNNFSVSFGKSDADMPLSSQGDGFGQSTTEAKSTSSTVDPNALPQPSTRNLPRHIAKSAKIQHIDELSLDDSAKATINTDQMLPTNPLNSLDTPICELDECNSSINQSSEASRPPIKLPESDESQPRKLPGENISSIILPKSNSNHRICANLNENVQSNLKITTPRNWNDRTRDHSVILTRRPSSCQSVTGQTLPPDTPRSATELRTMIYQNWRFKSNKNGSGPQRHNDKADELKRKKQEEQQKLESNRKAFAAWQAQKRIYLREELKKKIQAEELKRQQLEEKEEQKRSSEKAFAMWTNQKKALLLKQLNEKKAHEDKLRNEKLQEEQEKKSSAQKAFMAWRTKKEVEVRDTYRENLKRQMEEERRREMEERTKLEQAATAYQQWEMRKVSSPEPPRQNTTRQSRIERMPWRPSSARPDFTVGLRR